MPIRWQVRTAVSANPGWRRAGGFRPAPPPFSYGLVKDRYARLLIGVPAVRDGEETVVLDVGLGFRAAARPALGAGGRGGEELLQIGRDVIGRRGVVTDHGIDGVLEQRREL